jgi:hypothetical protein
MRRVISRTRRVRFPVAKWIGGSPACTAGERIFYRGGQGKGVDVGRLPVGCWRRGPVPGHSTVGPGMSRRSSACGACTCPSVQIRWPRANAMHAPARALLRLLVGQDMAWASAARRASSMSDAGTSSAVLCS